MRRSRIARLHCPQWRFTAGAVALAVVATVTITAPATGPAAAAPPAGGVGESGLAGEAHQSWDRDNRIGRVAPDSQLRGLAARAGGTRFTAFGTPSALGPVDGDLATGLSADPEKAARQYLTRHLDLFALTPGAVDALDTIARHDIGAGTVVTLRQRFGALPAAPDGLVSVLIDHGAVVRVTASLSRDTGAPAPATVDAADAVAAALRDVGVTAGAGVRTDVRQVAVPTPTDGPRAAYAVTINTRDAADPVAVTSYVDARTAAILVREDLVDFDSDNPRWAVFPAAATPSADGDGRELWCLRPAPACARAVHDPATGAAWDVAVATGTPTSTSRGNSVDDVVSWGAGAPAVPATASPQREYTYPFTDQWHQARCNPAVFASAQRNDADAAVSNLFAMHNRMHDWAYHLGFTEAAWNMQLVNVSGAGLGGDPETGRAQSNALGGSRNNANQGTPRDGLAPTTNMFLWQPAAGSAYPPCVDGDYDMTVIGHEFSHAITNRMIAGPDVGIGSTQGGSMGESWGDQLAAEYLYEHGIRAPGRSPFVTGAYVTGNNETGIRNYDLSDSPLNYSDIGYDLVGPEVHADGEIWSATSLRLRAALVARYGLGTPELQQRCADGEVAADACPGNRRWAQLLFDSFLLQAASQFSMLDMRDNMLAADRVRFGGADEQLMWEAFAVSGMGRDAVSGPNDTDPKPSFASPLADNATVTLRPGAGTAPVRLYVGTYEARATPVADTDPGTALPDTFQVVPDRPLSFVAVGAGLGHTRLTARFSAGGTEDLNVDLPTNLAASAAGATVSGPGVNLGKLIDDTEATDWASLDGVAGRQVTVDLAGDRPHEIDRVNVSALLRPAIAGDVDAGSQNRFSALRSFALSTCDATVADCSTDAGFAPAYRSAPDAFRGGAFRPLSPQLNLRTFTFDPVSATHVRLQVLASQCTGGPDYAGEQDADPATATDCATRSASAAQVRVSELQVFAR